MHEKFIKFIKRVPKKDIICIVPDAVVYRKDGLAHKRVFFWDIRYTVKIQNIILDIIKKSPREFVKIHHFSFGNSWYEYSMDELNKLTQNESKVVNNYYINRRIRTKNIKLKKFLNKIVDKNLYIDLHAGNVMKTKRGSYKLIDIEGCI